MHLFIIDPWYLTFSAFHIVECKHKSYNPDKQLLHHLKGMWHCPLWSWQHSVSDSIGLTTCNSWECESWHWNSKYGPDWGGMSISLYAENESVNLGYVAFVYLKHWYWNTYTGLQPCLCQLKGRNHGWGCTLYSWRTCVTLQKSGCSDFHYWTLKNVRNLLVRTQH